MFAPSLVQTHIQTFSVFFFVWLFFFLNERLAELLSLYSKQLLPELWSAGVKTTWHQPQWQKKVFFYWLILIPISSFTFFKLTSFSIFSFILLLKKKHNGTVTLLCMHTYSACTLFYIKLVFVCEDWCWLMHAVS